MERFHLKVTFVFIVTILIPSLLLCFFALQTVNYEQQQQKILRREQTERDVELFARNLSQAFDQPRVDLMKVLSKRREDSDDLLEFLPALQNFQTRFYQLSNLFLITDSGRRVYPRPNPSEVEMSDEGLPRYRVHPLALACGSIAGVVDFSGSHPENVLELANKFVETGQTRRAIELLTPFLESSDGRVRTTIALAVANCYVRLEDTDQAISVLRQGSEKNLGILGIGAESHEPVLAKLRLELGMLYRSQGKTSLASETITGLRNDLLEQYASLAPVSLHSIATRAELTLDLPRSYFKPIMERRTAAEQSYRDLELIFEGDFKQILSSVRQQQGSELAIKRQKVVRRADFAKHRARDKYLVVLYAPIFNQHQQFLGLCGFEVDLQHFDRGILEPELMQRNQNPDVRFLAHNPLFVHSEPEAKSDEDPAFMSKRLAEPLDHIHIRAYHKRTTPAVLTARSQARLHIWLIAMAMIGILLGVVVTVWTVQREARAAELKTDFVANVTHELKTPLTSIKLFIETLEMDHIENEEERRECLQIMSRETDRLTRLIDRLLAFSKLDRKRWKFRTAYISALDLVTEAIQLFRTQHGDGGIEIQVESLQNPTIAVDREAIVEVIYNLIHNAVKYTPSVGREVSITLAEGTTEVVISVIDNGVGVPREDRKRIFRKFERGSYAEKAQIQGSGIGLTLARSIVQGHGGDLKYYPNRPKGSRFVVTIPK